MDLGLRDARVIVTGGSRGMGRAAAEIFAEEGARVAVLARDPGTLENTVTTLVRRGSPDAVALPADLRARQEVEAAFAQIDRRWDGLEVLVNAAGPVDAGIGAFDDVDDENWKATFDIGTLSAVRCVRSALPLLHRGSFGRIVNVSAHSTKRQSPSLVAYTAAKAALTSLSKNLSQTLARDGILVNTVSPGTILSDALRGYLQALPPERGVDSDSLVDAMRVIREDFGHPAHLDRAGDPAEVGRVIAFVASPANGYMTGANLNVDGGSDFT